MCKLCDDDAKYGHLGDEASASGDLVKELLWTSEHAPFVTKQAAKVMREAAAALSRRQPSEGVDLHEALRKASYALFQIKRMVGADTVVRSFASDESDKACKALDAYALSRAGSEDGVIVPFGRLTSWHLSSPCLWCGYNGSDYWQAGTHGETCPWHNLGGEKQRIEYLTQISTLRTEQSKGGG